MPISSYSSPYNLGHKIVKEYYNDNFNNSFPFISQEKVDGSQFSFGIYEQTDGTVKLLCRSHNTQIDVNNPGMFTKAVETVRDLKERGLLVVDWTYRCEFLQKPKHNTLAYSRVPKGNIILFDIDRGEQDYVDANDLQYEALYLGLECVPVFGISTFAPTKEQLDEWLETESILGGTKIEGIVIKNYGLFGLDKKVLMAKYVSEAFKETHNKDWKDRNPNRADIVDKIIADFGGEPRWNKAVQHLEEDGELVHAPEDIGKLLKELAVDFEDECADEIKDVLWAHFRKQIIHGIQQGFPEWYKGECLK